MVRCEALAEAAHEAMYEARLRGAKGCYEEARSHFAGAIEAAQRAGLHEEAARLKRRRDHVARVYNSQFRYSLTQFVRFLREPPGGVAALVD